MKYLKTDKCIKKMMRSIFAIGRCNILEFLRDGASVVKTILKCKMIQKTSHSYYFQDLSNRVLTHI